MSSDNIPEMLTAAGSADDPSSFNKKSVSSSSGDEDGQDFKQSEMTSKTSKVATDVEGQHQRSQLVSSMSSMLDSKGDPFLSSVTSGVNDPSQHAMEWLGNLDDYPMRTFAIPIKDKTKFLINPVVCVIATIFLWQVNSIRVSLVFQQ